MCPWQILHTASQKLMIAGFTSTTQLNQCKAIWKTLLRPLQRKCHRKKLGSRYWIPFSVLHMHCSKKYLWVDTNVSTHIKKLLLHISVFCKIGTLLFLNWNKNCRESRLKDKRILQILFAGRILGVLSRKRKSASANCCSLCEKQGQYLGTALLQGPSGGVVWKNVVLREDVVGCFRQRALFVGSESWISWQLLVLTANSVKVLWWQHLIAPPSGHTSQCLWFYLQVSVLRSQDLSWTDKKKICWTAESSYCADKQRHSSFVFRAVLG